MDVLTFKKTGDVYFVQYEENEDIKTLKTEDEPESELTAVMDKVALLLLQLFKISDVTCKLQTIVWKDGEKAGSKCVLISGESMFGQFKMALPKVTTQEAETPEEGIYDPDHIKNQYNAAADELRKEVKRFLEGARRQRALPFDETKDKGDAGKKEKRKKKSVGETIGDLFNGKGKGKGGEED